MMKYINKLAGLAVLLLTVACKEENPIRPYGPDNDTSLPGTVSDVRTESIPGGAILRYKLPDNTDLMYVKATYHVGKGEKKEARASIYSNSLTVEGFGDTNPHRVAISCVDRTENEGKPVEVEIVPLTPPVKTVFESVRMDATFGGIYVSFQNPDKASLSFHVETTDEMNQLYEAHAQYTQAADGTFYVRGFESELRQFHLYLLDRWGNSSDTLSVSFTPFQETRLSKEKFNPYILPGDIECNAWAGNLAYAWNEDFTLALFVHSPGGDTFPMWFTFDMGVTAKLSRYKFYPLFMEQYAFMRGNLKHWEVWGTAETPSPDGSWDGWTKLMECNSYKPSGLPVGEHTAEDWEYIQNGEDFEFPAEAPAVRYIRFKVYETWGGNDFIHFTEFTFWGNPV